MSISAILIKLKETNSPKMFKYASFSAMTVKEI